MVQFVVSENNELWVICFYCTYDWCNIICQLSILTTTLFMCLV